MSQQISDHYNQQIYKESQPQSLEQIVEQYAPLVKRIAHHLTGRMPPSVSVQDMIQSGMIGLLEAAKKYDGSKGASFETYAGIRIRGAMLDEIRKGDWAPRSVHRNTRRVTDAIRSIENRHGRDAKDSEIAAEMGVGTEEYFKILNDTMTTKLFSLNELSSNEDGSSGHEAEGDLPEPSQGLQREALMKALTNAIANLPERERLVLALYYDEELNLREIGEVLGVSESRVSQIHSQAAARLRARLQGWSD